MTIITGERGAGKSSELIKISEKTGYPIVVRDGFSAKYIKDLAKTMGASIPDVYTEMQLKNGRLRGTDYRGIVIDEADSIIEKALAYYLSVSVKAVSVDRNNVFLLSDENA